MKPKVAKWVSHVPVVVRAVQTPTPCISAERLVEIIDYPETADTDELKHISSCQKCRLFCANRI